MCFCVSLCQRNEGIRSLELQLQVTISYWEPNASFLRDHKMLLTTELSLQPQVLYNFFISLYLCHVKNDTKNLYWYCLILLHFSNFSGDLTLLYLMHITLEGVQSLLSFPVNANAEPFSQKSMSLVH